MTDNNTKQSRMTVQSSASINEILNNISTMAVNTGSIAEVSSTMSEKAKTGSSSVQMMSQQMNLINESVEEAGKGLASLNSSTTEISEMSSLITGISEQTNLFALNAAIEAARAGEQGKGFAVVAEEVRKLADESNQSAQQIKGLALAIQGESEDTQRNIRVVHENVTIGLNVASNTSHNFNEIVSLVEQVTAQIQEIAAAVKRKCRGDSRYDFHPFGSHKRNGQCLSGSGADHTGTAGVEGGNLSCGDFPFPIGGRTTKNR